MQVHFCDSMLVNIFWDLFVKILLWPNLSGSKANYLFDKKKTIEGRHRILRYGLIYSWRPWNTPRGARRISKIVYAASPQRPRRAGIRLMMLWRCQGCYLTNENKEPIKFLNHRQGCLMDSELSLDPISISNGTPPHPFLLGPQMPATK